MRRRPPSSPLFPYTTLFGSVHLARAREHAAGVGSEVGLGEPEAADQLALRQLRQVLHALRLAAVLVDRVHDERALHRGERTQAGVAALELLDREPVRRGRHARAAVLLRQRRAEEPHFGDLGDHVLREVGLLVRLLDDRQVARLDPAAHVVADLDLLLLEQRIDLVEIHTGEAGHRELLAEARARGGGQGKVGAREYRGSGESVTNPASARRRRGVARPPPAGVGAIHHDADPTPREGAAMSRPNLAPLAALASLLLLSAAQPVSPALAATPGTGRGVATPSVGYAQRSEER